MKSKLTILALIPFFLPLALFSQINEDKLGAWYMYFWNAKVKETPWGFQGDIQFRNWNLGGDLEQLLLRGGVTYKPKNSQVKFTQGYGYVATGEFGSGNATTSESRIYQEALIPHKVAERFFLTHRFRFEQRWVESQNFRTRYRYNLFLNVALNKKVIEPGTVYLALYNELFINGQRKITATKSVEIFDRNRAYAAIGYNFAKGMKAQLGIMQQNTDTWKKRQAQLSFHHTF